LTRDPAAWETATRIQEPLDKIRVGRVTPETISVRALLPDTSVPMAVPCRAEDRADDPELRERARNIMTGHTQAVVGSVQELQDLGLVNTATAEVRVHRCAQLFKLYILNGDEVFFGFYPVHEHSFTVKRAPRPIYDVLGKDSRLRVSNRGVAVVSNNSENGRPGVPCRPPARRPRRPGGRPHEPGPVPSEAAPPT
jgi:hypothetical protein